MVFFAIQVAALCVCVCDRSLARILDSNPAGAWMSLVNIVCCVGRGLCFGLITRPEDTYRVWCVLKKCDGDPW